MEHDDLDHILSGEREIAPSSGFAKSVMDAVRREASAPPPIPFPWKRAMSGLFAASYALLSIIAMCVESFRQEPKAQPIPAHLLSSLALAAQVWRTMDANWISVALILSFAAMKSPALFTLGQESDVQ